ncbi:undecaprenyl-phosphate 4-deoxy-4-formamido-L-arabinose transferase [Fibrobacter sp. UWB15]|uniref:glycosyltransferase family 2 protein n=1 Tax=unclassified Fibrobacter TaxID=2634177 RepID=UPI0009240733|nr:MULTISPECIES: glycosyltransferase family 2 protein [unclassified Fibrobacter]PWJ66349.1 undecaprenyl-phosphate 4-deoxy-4-formamido-L-arabinose transferase [Fibrobacter sp. UWB6]SHG36962.1 undecaprenyl-phosphate 4-deoxy-4-formamido-L-arabinose transferase [Fibrobacter sp. UWB8]SMG20493.1 undecaprenyl-phosphate 4-deoxy-4-formamido-L-arabinose transferase [Fibrobacter sp. UWB15]
MKLSFVIPCYRSENTIETVVQEIRETVATRPGTDYEIVLVNDCSPDNVWQVIKKLASENNHIKGICLAKNFGQHSALMAGYGQATGDYIISLDDDGQTPASESFKLVDKLEEGYDVVYGYYEHSAQHLFRRFGTWVNKKMAEAIIGQPKTLRTTSFFIMRKFIVDEIVRYPNPFAYISGLVFRATKNLGNVEVQHRRRLEGRSGYTIAGLIGLWINGFTAFSVKPLRAATFIGVICALVGFVAGLYVVYQKFLNPEIPVGYTSMLATLLFVGGMIMLLLGLIGEYVGRIYISINQSPQYVVRERTF